MGLKDIFKGKAITKPIGENPAAWTMLQGGWPSRWSKFDKLFRGVNMRGMEASYAHPVIRACIQTKATTASEPFMDVGYWDGVDSLNRPRWVSVPQHPLQEVLDNPNGHYSTNDFVQYFVTRLELTGISYSLKLRNMTGSTLNELWPLPTSWVTPIPSRSGTELFSGYRINGQSKVFTPDEVFYTRYIDPLHPATFNGPYNAIYRDHALDLEGENYLAEMLINLKVPGISIVNKSGKNDADKRAQIRREIQSAIGAPNRGEPLYLEGDIDIGMHNPLADLSWPNFTETREARLCMAYGVPPIVIGARFGLMRSTYSNYAQAEKVFYQRTMRPLWTMLEDSLTTGLLRTEGDDVHFIRFRYDQLPAFQEDKTIRSQRIREDFKAQLITREEAREQLEYPEKVNGDTWFSGGLPIMNPAGEGDPLNQPANTPQNGSTNVPAKPEQE